MQIPMPCQFNIFQTKQISFLAFETKMVCLCLVEAMQTFYLPCPGYHAIRLLPSNQTLLVCEPVPLRELFFMLVFLLPTTAPLPALSSPKPHHPTTTPSSNASLHRTDDPLDNSPSFGLI